MANSSYSSIPDDKKGIISIAVLGGKKCVIKKLADQDISYHLEREASRRMASVDQIYKIIKPYRKGADKFIASEYVHGVDFYDRLETLSEQQITSLVCQVMLLIHMIHVAGMSHNDMHLRNIRIQDTKTAILEYNVGGRIYKIPSFGTMAVIIDFGLATVMKPSGLFTTSVAYCGDQFLTLDPRYDMYRFLGALIGSVVLKFHMRVPPCQKLLKFVHDAITGPQKVNTESYFALNGLVIKEFRNHLTILSGMPMVFTARFFQYMLMIPKASCSISRGACNFSLNEKRDALRHLNKVPFHLVENKLYKYITTKTLDRDIAWVVVIKHIWDDFYDANASRFRAQIDSVFHQTYFQSPLDLVDIIVTSLII